MRCACDDLQYLLPLESSTSGLIKAADHLINRDYAQNPQCGQLPGHVSEDFIVV